MTTAETAEAAALDPDHLPPMLTINQTAALLGVHRNHIADMVREGRAPFPAVKVGAVWRIASAPLVRWMNGETT